MAPRKKRKDRRQVYRAATADEAVATEAPEGGEAADQATDDQSTEKTIKGCDVSTKEKKQYSRKK